MTNGCPVCGGLGRVLAFGVCRDPIPVTCPECAGLAITPASAEDEPMIAWRTSEITAFLLGRWPALPPASEVDLVTVQSIDELTQSSV